MNQTVRELMTPMPKTVAGAQDVATVATVMRDHGVGAVVVLQGNAVHGIVTDRDIAVRAIADGKDPWSTSVAEITSRTLITLSPDDPVDHAIELMRLHAVRRLPVVEAGIPIGIVSIGDLAQERDPGSALAGISAAPANL